MSGFLLVTTDKPRGRDSHDCGLGWTLWSFNQDQGTLTFRDGPSTIRPGHWPSVIRIVTQQQKTPTAWKLTVIWPRLENCWKICSLIMVFCSENILAARRTTLLDGENNPNSKRKHEHLILHSWGNSIKGTYNGIICRWWGGGGGPPICPNFPQVPPPRPPSSKGVYQVRFLYAVTPPLF